MVLYEQVIEGTVVRSTSPNIPYRRYNPPRILGRGSFSEVEKVQTALGEERAVKNINCTPASFPYFLEEFLLCRLPPNFFCLTPNHITWTGANDNSSMVTLEFDVFDGNLEEYFQRQISVEQRIADITIMYRHLRQAVYFLLDNGIYHVDIKPANILYRITNNPQNPGVNFLDVRFADFGISYHTPCLADLGKDYIKFVKGGTPIFYPPEQNVHDSYIASSMFYTLALSMYWCLTRNREHMEALRNDPIVNRPLISLDQYLPYCSPDQRNDLNEIVFVINAPFRGRKFFIPPRHFQNEEIFRAGYPPSYSSTPEILQKIRNFFRGGNDDEIIRAFIYRIYQETILPFNYRIDGEMRNLTMGIIEFIKVVDCLSRFLKRGPYFGTLIPVIVALVRSEALRCDLRISGNDDTIRTIPIALNVLNVLDYRLFDCTLSPAFFCFKDNPHLGSRIFMDMNNFLPDLFINPPVNISSFILTHFPQLRESCVQPVAYENIINDTEFYRRRFIN